MTLLRAMKVSFLQTIWQHLQSQFFLPFPLFFGSVCHRRPQEKDESRHDITVLMGHFRCSSGTLFKIQDIELQK